MGTVGVGWGKWCWVRGGMVEEVRSQMCWGNVGRGMCCG